MLKTELLLVGRVKLKISVFSLLLYLVTLQVTPLRITLASSP